MKRYDSYKDSGVKWIGEIPSHWKIEPFGRHFQYGKGLPITKANLQEKGIAVISYGQIHAKENLGTTLSDGLVRYVSSKYLETNPQSLLKQGDFVFADTSEDIEGSGNVAFNDYPNPIFAGYHTVIAHPIDLIFPKYDAYLFQSKYWKSQIQSLVNGVKVYSINKSIIKQSILLFPPLLEQRAIVSFLDTELGKIDTYMDKEQQLIERLKELKQSLIARAVTHGIDPNVKMKPSGINWIGEIPEHWEVKRLGSHFIENRHINSELTETEAYKFNYGSLIRKDIDVNLKEVEDIYRKYTLLNKNDIVINGLNLNYDFVSQRVAKAETKGIITSAYLVLTPRKGVDVNYFCYLFKAMDSQKLFHGMGSGIRLTLSFEDLKSQLLPIPPLSEQRAIVDYLQDKTSKIDKLITEKTRELEYMKELRQRIISDAVTGKIDVRS